MSKTLVITTHVTSRLDEKKKKRRSDFQRRPATARFNKLASRQSKKSEHSGKRTVKYRNKDGIECTRTRRFRPSTRLKQRIKFYANNTHPNNQKGSTVVQARVNTFIKTIVPRIKKDIGETGIYWSNSDDVNFQCNSRAKELLGLHMAQLQNAVYADASKLAQLKTEATYQSQAEVQIHERHVTSAIELRLSSATRGPVTWNSGKASTDVSTPNIKSGKVSRARFLSTNEQRGSVKALYNISRAKKAVRNEIDTFVKQQSASVLESAMIQVYTDNRVQISYDDLERAIDATKIFPAVLTGL